jgi:hypothetical protein
VNIENENTQPATRETMPEYLDRLAADQIEAGADATGADIKAAAAEIRKLQVEIGRMANAQAYAADREAQLSAAIFGLIEDHVQTVVENEVQTAIVTITILPITLTFGDAVDRAGSKFQRRGYRPRVTR